MSGQISTEPWTSASPTPSSTASPGIPGDEQKAVKTTAFDLQLNPASPETRFHKLDKAKDKNFWSVGVSSDIG